MSRRKPQPEPEQTTTLPAPALTTVTPPPLPRRRHHDDATESAVSGSTSANRARQVILELSDGTRRPLRGTLIIGRQPTQPERYGDVLALPDTTRTLSRDHLEVGITPGGQVWVSDMGSANGSYVARGPAWTRLTPHQRTPIDANDMLRFADFSLRIAYDDPS
ncbi:FHA domain-containing protein [Cellulomonas sp. NPDC089187]|uniref:FHA domain-containing protein n=1 Tax=Cellulomonas sp. NPDC089187 TaxID=3154970 RepID=UPI003416D746